MFDRIELIYINRIITLNSNYATVCGKIMTYFINQISFMPKQLYYASVIVRVKGDKTDFIDLNR